MNQMTIFDIEPVSKSGFYDISKKPKTMSKAEHRKLIELQNLLKYCNERLDLYKADQRNFRVLQEISARYKIVVFQHFPEVTEVWNR